MLIGISFRSGTVKYTRLRCRLCNVGFAILYHKYVPSVENPLIQIPVSGETVEVEYVEGFEKKLYDMMPSAYIVALSECTISRTNV